jgi:hypothetical protein
LNKDTPYPRIIISRRQPDERFTLEGRDLPFTLLDFWQWASSDLMDNMARGILAEFIVAAALDLTGGVRDAWNPTDLTTREGIRLQIKSAGYQQSSFQRAPSKISFSIGKKRAFSPDDNTLSHTAEHHADVYVFCLFKHPDKKTLNPLDIGQWTFFVLPTSVLVREAKDQKTIGFDRLKKLGATESDFWNPSQAIKKAYDSGTV